MFLRVVRAAGRKGVKNEYVRVVEAYRENGKTRHRTVLNLGRRDLLAAHLDVDKLQRLLQGRPVPIARWRIARFGTRTLRRSRHGIGDRCWWRAICGANSASKQRLTGSLRRCVARPRA